MSQRRACWSRRIGTALMLTALGGMAAAQPPADLELELEPLVSGLVRPVNMAAAPDGSNRLFIVEQEGVVRIFDGARLLDRPFLDLRGRISSDGERGLLGLAFHPRYRENGLLFVDFTNRSGNTRVVRMRVSDDPNVVDPSTMTTILSVAQFASNHNGGHIAFGPDGMLYVALGDGGGGGDPRRHGQNRGTLLGSILRLDVDGPTPLTVPPDNPFVGDATGRDEIWVYGLRNPWRFSFDRANGDLFIGDVGQGAWEEINRQRASSGGGENYGWNRMEGPDCFPPGSACDTSGLTAPVIRYDRSQGRSVTGGYRYRGSRFPSLRRTYLYADFASGNIWGARPDGTGNWLSRLLLASGRAISTFGEDRAGELYVADYVAGEVLRVVAAGGDGDEGGGDGASCPLPAGHPAFCRDCGPCTEGQGDCDRDSDCAEGTVCRDNVGAAFGFGAGIDVCTAPATGCPWEVGDGRFCRDCGPCGDGEGDCDNDSECVVGTSCVDDVGAEFGFAPGVDVCRATGSVPPPTTCPLPPGHGDFCRDCGPCGPGEGDCDRDSDCRDGLRCVDDIGADFGFAPRVDVCQPG